MLTNRIVEHVFFFGLMGVVAFLVWKMLAPFVSALALAAIIVTVSYPLYEKIIAKVPKKNRSVAAFLTTLIVIVAVVLPLFLVASSLINEALSIYNLAGTQQIGFEESISHLEETVQKIAPGFELNFVEYIRQTSAWMAGNLGAIFAGTASTIFLFFISFIGSFYLFRDGEAFTKRLVHISPLPDTDDELILHRMAMSVRSVLTGVVSVALIQGVLTALGLHIFGFERAVLWGTIATFGALIPSVGTSIVFIPSIIYLIFFGEYVNAIGLTVWAMLAVGLIDNLLGPYLMSRGSSLHPFLILLAVLGGISVFGPVGFIVGPVILSLFIVLLELYNTHLSPPQE